MNAKAFYQPNSEMSSLCPECANVLYGYENCKHEFSGGRCLKCYWDGSTSTYVKNLNQAKMKNILKNETKLSE